MINEERLALWRGQDLNRRPVSKRRFDVPLLLLWRWCRWLLVGRHEGLRERLVESVIGNSQRLSDGKLCPLRNPLERRFNVRPLKKKSPTSLSYRTCCPKNRYRSLHTGKSRASIFRCGESPRRYRTYPRPFHGKRPPSSTAVLVGGGENVLLGVRSMIHFGLHLIHSVAHL